VVKGDGLTGTLTSTEFLIDFDTIEFLVGGGRHIGKTCVNLVIEGRVALSATGMDNNQMSLNTWNVRQFAGKKAKIQVVDNHVSGWGNIGLEPVVFKTAIQAQAPKPDTLSQKNQSKNSSPSQLDKTAIQNLVRAWHKGREKLASQIIRTSRIATAMHDVTSDDYRILLRDNSAKPGDLEARHLCTAMPVEAPLSISMVSGWSE